MALPPRLTGEGGSVEGVALYNAAMETSCWYTSLVTSLSRWGLVVSCGLWWSPSGPSHTGGDSNLSVVHLVELASGLVVSMSCG